VSPRTRLRPIVLIDDDQDETFITAWRLRKAGIENPQIVFTTPEEALRFFQQAANCETELPALVLCDVKLPGIRGHELIASAKLQKCLRAVPLWMLSNSSFHIDIAHAKTAGADGFLVKPLSLTIVHTILEGMEPAEDRHCYVFRRETPPVVRSVQGRLEVAVEDVPLLRRTMARRGTVVAEVDRDLRYVWIDNPHSDFDPALVVGKRDDELIASDEAAEIMAIKRQVIEDGRHASHVLTFRRSDGWHCYRMSAYPIRSRDGVVEGVITRGVDWSDSEQTSESTT
jgi:CheY-like chemotaxis protein